MNLSPLVSFLASVCLALPALAQKPSAIPAPGTVLAIVNGEKILQSDVDSVFYSQNSMAKLPAAQVQQTRMRAQASTLENVIAKVLLVQAANKAQVKVTEAEIQTEVERLQGTLPFVIGKDGKPTTARVTLKQHLKAMRWTYPKFREEIRYDQAVTKLLEAKASIIPKPSEISMKQFFQQNIRAFSTPASIKAQHILVSTQNASDPAEVERKRAMAEGVRKQLLASKGKNFEKLAKETSDCPSRDHGGDLGMFARGQMVAEFEEVAFNQKIGEIGKVVQTPMGFHIIRVEKKIGATLSTFDAAKPKIVEHLTGRQRSQVIQKFVTELKSKAKIQRLWAPPK